MPNTVGKNLEIKVALMEQGFTDIKKRLDHIETKLESLSLAINRGMGAWRGLLLVASFVATVVTILKNVF